MYYFMRISKYLTVISICASYNIVRYFNYYFYVEHHQYDHRFKKLVLNNLEKN